MTYKYNYLRRDMSNKENKVDINQVAFSHTRMRHFYKEIKEKGWSSQTVKNKLYTMKKDMKFCDYIALQAAYHKYKLLIEFEENDKGGKV